MAILINSLIFNFILNLTLANCKVANWWGSFDKKGWSTCAGDNYFITGLYRYVKGTAGNDGISRLESADCCTASKMYSDSAGECKTAKWAKTFDKYVNNNKKTILHFYIC